MLEADGPLEKTWKFKQREIKDHVDMQSSEKVLLLRPSPLNSSNLFTIIYSLYRYSI